jgi:hypothetical protein
MTADGNSSSGAEEHLHLIASAMVPTRSVSIGAAIAYGAAILLAGCALVSSGCSSNTVGPSNQSQIGNLPDNFQFHASNLSQTTQTSTYSWTNTGTVGTVNQSGQIGSGDATLTIRDGSGNQVYSKSLSSTGTFASASGTAGSWQIEVRLSDTTGTVNFQVQRGP